MSTQQLASSSLGATACWTAAVRAHEQTRLDRLFDDPWAAALAGAEGAAWMAQRTPESVVPIVLRTRYFDDFLQRVAVDSGVRQVVLMAAGLDTRAFRLTWPAGTHLFELDQPAVLDHKAETLAAAGAEPQCTRHVLKVDLTTAWSDLLVAAGFDVRKPAVILAEGFLFYLPNEEIVRILDTATGVAVPGSWLGFDIINGQVLTSPWTRPWVEMQAKAGAPWIGTLDDPVGLLDARGWQASVTQAGAPEANHGRWVLPMIPPTLPAAPHNWYVTAEKR